MHEDTVTPAAHEPPSRRTRAAMAAAALTAAGWVAGAAYVTANYFALSSTSHATPLLDWGIGLAAATMLVTAAAWGAAAHRLRRSTPDIRVGLAHTAFSSAITAVALAIIGYASLAAAVAVPAGVISALLYSQSSTRSGRPLLIEQFIAVALIAPLFGMLALDFQARMQLRELHRVELTTHPDVAELLEPTLNATLQFQVEGPAIEGHGHAYVADGGITARDCAEVGRSVAAAKDRGVTLTDLDHTSDRWVATNRHAFISSAGNWRQADYLDPPHPAFIGATIANEASSTRFARPGPICQLLRGLPHVLATPEQTATRGDTTIFQAHYDPDLLDHNLDAATRQTTVDALQLDGTSSLTAALMDKTGVTAASHTTTLDRHGLIELHIDTTTGVLHELVVHTTEGAVIDRYTFTPDPLALASHGPLQAEARSHVNETT